MRCTHTSLLASPPVSQGLSLLSPVVHHSAQPRDSPINVMLHISIGVAQLFANLLEGIAMEIVEHQSQLLLFGETPKCGQHAPVPQVGRIRIMSPRCNLRRRSIPRIASLPAAVTRPKVLQLVKAFGIRHVNDPRTGGTLRWIKRPTLPRKLREYLLSYIFRLGRISENTRADRVDKLVVASIKDVQGIYISVLQKTHESLITHMLCKPSLAARKNLWEVPHAERTHTSSRDGRLRGICPGLTLGALSPSSNRTEARKRLKQTGPDGASARNCLAAFRSEFRPRFATIRPSDLF